MYEKVEVEFHAFLASTVIAVSIQLHAPAASLPLKKSPSTHWIGD
jgi:hypothetical protein